MPWGWGCKPSPTHTKGKMLAGCFDNNSCFSLLQEHKLMNSHSEKRLGPLNMAGLALRPQSPSCTHCEGFVRGASLL